MEDVFLMNCYLHLQEIMENPQIAADGYTYEAEAISGWLNSGHDILPMTNLTLDNLNPVPNYALQNVIQQWQLQQWHIIHIFIFLQII